MTIRETPVIDTLDIAYRDASGSWVNLNNKATSVSVQRGGKRSGVSNKIDVGTLTAELYGAVDLETSQQLTPNTPIRVAGRGGLPGAIVETTQSAWVRTIVPGATLQALAQSRPALDDVPAGSRSSYSATLAANTSVDYAAGVRGYRAIAASVLLPGRIYRASVRVNDWAAENAVPLQFEVRYHPTSNNPTVAGGYVVATAQARPIDATRYSALPMIEWEATETSGYYIICVIATKPITYPAQSASRTVAGFSFFDYKFELLPSEPPAVFTGTVADLVQREEFDKNTGKSKTFTTLLAVDNVAPIANTQRYGAVVEQGGGFENWEDRIRRLALSSPVPVRVPRASGARTAYAWNGWTRDGWNTVSFAAPFATDAVPTSVNVPPAQWPYRYAFYLQLRNNTGANVTAAIGTQGIGRVFTGLTPGATYRVEANATTWENYEAVPSQLRIGVAGIGASAALTVPQSPTGVTLTPYQFTATGTTHTVQVTNAAAITLAPGKWVSWQIQPTRLIEVGRVDPYRLQDTVFESDLASQFDLACNSTGGYWWVDRQGITQFRPYAEAQTLTGIWTDDPFKATEPGYFEYVDIETAFDTRALVTELTLDNKGRKLDPDGKASADDDSSTFRDGPSAERWGVRGATLSTSLYTGQGFENALQSRANDVFEQYGNAQRSITGFRWNAQENTAQALSLDIYDAIRVERGALPVTGRIIGLKHTITPTRWMVDVELTDVKAGVQFDDFNRALGVRTYAQLNTRLGSATYLQLNADPLGAVAFV